MSENTQIHDEIDLNNKVVPEKHFRNMTLRRLMSSSAIVQDDLLAAITEKTCGSNCGHDHHEHNHHAHYVDEE